MSLSFKSLFDRLAAPAPVVDKFGQDALTGKSFDRFVSRPDILLPLLATASASVIAVATRDAAQAAGLFAWASYGVGIHLFAKNSFEEAALKKEWPSYFLDRRARAPRQATLPQNIQEDLESKMRSGRQSTFRAIWMWGPFFGLDMLIMGRPSVAMSALILAQLSDHGARYWRARQALAGEWNVMERKPALPDNRLVPPSGPRMA